MSQNNQESEFLPTTAEQLSIFVESIITKFDLPRNDQTVGMICQEIMHMGRTVDRAPLVVFAAAVRKQLSNDVAYAVIEGIRKKLKAEAANQEESAQLEKQQDGAQGATNITLGADDR